MYAFTLAYFLTPDASSFSLLSFMSIPPHVRKSRDSRLYGFSFSFQNRVRPASFVSWRRGKCRRRLICKTNCSCVPVPPHLCPHVRISLVGHLFLAVPEPAAARLYGCVRTPRVRRAATSCNLVSVRSRPDVTRRTRIQLRPFRPAPLFTLLV